MQTPTSPVNLACAVAAKAAISSWRVWMNSSASADVERAEQAVDAVARIAVDPLDAPLPEAFQNELRDLLAHVAPFLGGPAAATRVAASHS